MQDSKKPGEPLAQRIERARRVGAALSEATDTLNAALAKAEKALAGLHLGVSASITLTDLENTRSYYQEIAFKKEAGEWRIVVIEGDVQNGQETVTPILRASRAIRFEAAAVLPRLVDELMIRAEKQLDAARQHAARVDELVRKLGA